MTWIYWILKYQSLKYNSIFWNYNSKGITKPKIQTFKKQLYITGRYNLNDYKSSEAGAHLVYLAKEVLPPMVFYIIKLSLSGKQNELSK